MPKDSLIFWKAEKVEITASYPAGKTDSTKENLFAAAEGEHEEWSDLYPSFARTAEEEGLKNISTAFKAIAAAEKGHEEKIPETS